MKTLGGGGCFAEPTIIAILYSPFIILMRIILFQSHHVSKFIMFYHLKVVKYNWGVLFYQLSLFIVLVFHNIYESDNFFSSY